MRAAPSRLDRFIGWLSPTAGARRYAARVAMQSLAGYEGGKLTYRTEGWRTPQTSADSAGETERDTLRNRARDLVRNNAHASKALEIKVAHTIGEGFTAEVKNKRLKPEWDRFVETCDFTGDYDLNGLFGQMERCRSESGECLVRFVRTGSYGRSAVPTQLQVLEPDFLDTSKDTFLGSGAEIRYGIQYNALGQREGYWLFPQHPGDRATLAAVAARGMSSEFVPAEDVIHIYRKLRPGQTRGVTDFAPVIMLLRDLDDFQDAHVLAKKIAACFVGALTTPESLSSTGVGPQTLENDITKERMTPGRFYRLRPGETMNFTNPPMMDGYDAFKRWTARDIAAGTGVPYELLTSDLSELNYTSMRGGLIDFRKRVRAEQYLLYLPRVCRRIEARFREDMGVARPGLGDRTAFEWTPSKFELMDPLKETQARLEAVLAGFESYGEVARENGWAQDDLLDEIGKWLEALDARGITLKSDPRRNVSSTREPAEPNEPSDREAA